MSELERVMRERGETPHRSLADLAELKPLDQAFEILGEIREHLDDLQVVAADLDSSPFSVDVNTLRRWNTSAIERITRLRMIERETTGLRDEDLDSHHAAEPRGG